MNKITVLRLFKKIRPGKARIKAGVMPGAAIKAGALVIAGFMAIGAAGCGPAVTGMPEDTAGTSEGTGSPAGEAAVHTGNTAVDLTVPLAAEDREKTTLTVWYSASGATGEAFTEAVEAFDAGSDLVDITLSYSGNADDTAYKVNAAMIAGTAPDVALMYSGPVFTGGSDNYSLNYLIQRDGFDPGDIFPGLWDFCRYYKSDAVCAVPYGISTQLLYYNKAILTEAGIDLTDPPKTWDEFRDICRECASLRRDGRFAAFDAVQADWLFKTMLHQNGCPLVKVSGETVEPALTGEEAVETAAFWQSLAEEGLMPAGEHEIAEEKFLSGNLAFLAMSSNRIPRWEDANISIGAIPMPGFGEPSTAIGGTVLVILTPDRQKIEAAWDLISYLMEPGCHAAFALASGYLPVRASELELPEVKEAISDNAMYGIAFDQLSFAWSYTFFDEMGTFNRVIDEALESLEREHRPPEDVLEEAAESFRRETQ